MSHSDLYAASLYSDIRRQSIPDGTNRRDSHHSGNARRGSATHVVIRRDSAPYDIIRRESVPFNAPHLIVQNELQENISTGLMSVDQHIKGDVSLNDSNHSSMKGNEVPNNQETIVVIGTGDLGRALVSCIVRAGYRAVVASRNPDRNRQRIATVGGEVFDIPNALSQSEIIMVAIPYNGYESLPANLLERKILVDVSNRPSKKELKGQCLAINLQNILPNSIVVKAFNTLSAYALQKGLLQGSKVVPVCSDDDEAKQKVITLARNLGFVPVDSGSLANAKEIEDIPFTFFKDWKFGVKFAFVVWVIAFILQLFRQQLCPNFAQPWEWNWQLFASLPLSTVHQSFALTALTLLASCYFPGVIAAYLQLWRGTKFSEFPKWLDEWLKGRKGLGLLALLLASMHCILAIMSKMKYGMTGVWRESSYLASGTFSLALMAILGVTSLPSVSASLTWREFSFVQRYLGWCSLWFGTFHLIFIQWNRIIENQLMCIFLPSGTQIFIILPVLTIILKLPLLLPCIDNYVQKIRSGYQRGDLITPA